MFCLEVEDMRSLVVLWGLAFEVFLGGWGLGVGVC
jgi:hypothetical protein